MMKRGFVFGVLIVLVLGGVFALMNENQIKSLTGQNFEKNGDYYEWKFGEDKADKTITIGENTYNVKYVKGQYTHFKVDEDGSLIEADFTASDETSLELSGGECIVPKDGRLIFSKEDYLGDEITLIEPPLKTVFNENPLSSRINGEEVEFSDYTLQKGYLDFNEEGMSSIPKGETTEINDLAINAPKTKSVTVCSESVGCRGIGLGDKELKLSGAEVEFKPENKWISLTEDDFFSGEVPEDSEISISSSGKVPVVSVKTESTVMINNEGSKIYVNQKEDIMVAVTDSGEDKKFIPMEVDSGKRTAVITKDKITFPKAELQLKDVARNARREAAVKLYTKKLQDLDKQIETFAKFGMDVPDKSQQLYARYKTKLEKLTGTIYVAQK